MALFLDSADLEEIQSGMQIGIYSGVTTNPSLLAPIEPAERLKHLARIADLCPGSVYMQVDLRPVDEMEQQAIELRKLAPGRTIIKVPVSPEGLALCGRLRSRGIPACVTAVFSSSQAYAAAAAGAHAAAVYVGRLNRRGEDGCQVVGQAIDMIQASGSACRVLAASIPDVETLCRLLSLPGVDATVPFRLQEPLLTHPGTREAVQEFGKNLSR